MTAISHIFNLLRVNDGKMRVSVLVADMARRGFPEADTQAALNDLWPDGRIKIAGDYVWLPSVHENPEERNNPFSNRWYVACNRCFTKAVIEYPGHLFAGSTVCGSCGGQLRVMGQVFEDDPSRYGYEGERTPCDERCTSATGPACDCKCGGKNHGSHLLVTYRVVQGKAVVDIVPSDKAQARRAEVDSLEAEVRAKLEAARGRRDSATAYLLEAGLYKARRLKTHSGIVKALRSLLDRAARPNPRRRDRRGRS